MPVIQETGTGQAFTRAVKQALTSYYQDAQLDRLQSLAELPLVAVARQRRPTRSPADALRAVLDEGLARLEETDALAATILRGRYLAQEPVAQLARTLDYSERALYHHQRRALAALSQLLWQANEQARRLSQLTPQQKQALDRLPPPSFSRLFGVDETLQTLVRFVCAANAHFLVALHGMGGMGKTALARAAAEALIYEGCVARVIWITVQQRLFAWGRAHNLDAPALTYEELLEELAARCGLEQAAESVAERERRIRAALRETATLVVVDNLETAADVESLVMGLHRLARPAKILMTSRYAVGAYDSVTSVATQPLSLYDAIDFIRFEGRDRNVPALQQATADDLQRMARITEGHPLAIKLLVGQLLTMPLRQVLADLVQVHQNDHDLYHYLFAYAWRHLSPTAQQLLLHMPLLDARGTTWQHLAAVAGVTADGTFCESIQELVNASLLNLAHSNGDTVYSIHRLTEYFILSELVHVMTPAGI